MPQPGEALQDPMRENFMFSSESVTEGHPDKLCDQISDAIVGRFLRQDPLSRVTAECSVSTGIIFLAVKYSSRAMVDVASTAREVIRQTGYQHSQFNADTCSIVTSVTELPLDNRSAQDEQTLSGQEIDAIVASDQVTLFGFACRHTETLMPLPILLAHQLAKRLAAVRKEGVLGYLAPDGKTQIGIEFRNRRPVRIHSITLLASVLESGACTPKQARQDLRETVIEDVFGNSPLKPDANTRIAINPHDVGVSLGGPAAHSGLTGRKTGIDTYGEYARHSGAALSGKDPSRIDRTGAYIARYAAKNVVAAGLADECEVLLSYAIGLAQPVSVQVDTAGTGRVEDDEIVRRLTNTFDFRPGSIIRDFDLRGLPHRHANGFYQSLAAYGQVGRNDLDLPWERIDRTKALDSSG